MPRLERRALFPFVWMGLSYFLLFFPCSFVSRSVLIYLLSSSRSFEVLRRRSSIYCLVVYFQTFATNPVRAGTCYTYMIGLLTTEEGVHVSQFDQHGGCCEGTKVLSRERERFFIFILCVKKKETPKQINTAGTIPTRREWTHSSKSNKQT